MDVIDLWQEVFAKHANRVRQAWARMEPAWETLREFRDRAGFHADKPKFFTARHRVRKEWDSLVGPALAEFEDLFKFFLKAEAAELQEFESELDSLLDELEVKHAGTKFQRKQFKAYLMIPDSAS